MFSKLSKMLKIYKFAATAKLIDGTDIFIDGDLAEGTKVYVVTSDGNIPLPDGEYELEDGMLFTIVEGVISDVKESAPEGEGEEVEEKKDEEVEAGKEEPKEKEVKAESETETETKTSEKETNEKETETEEETEMENEQLEGLDAISEKINSIIERIKELENFNSNLEELKKQNQEFSTQIDEFKEKLEKIPGATPTKKKVETYSPIGNSNKRLQVLKNLNG